MLCFQRLSTAVAFSFSFSSCFSSNRIQDHEGLFAWPVIQLEGCHHVYGFAPWMLVNNVKKEGNPSICRIQALWLTILVWHSPCSRSIRREDRSAAVSGSLLALIHPLLVFKSGALLH